MTVEQTALVDSALEYQFLAAAYEQAACGDTDATLLLRTIPAAVFATPPLRATWTALQAIYQDGGSLDLVTLETYLERANAKPCGSWTGSWAEAHAALLGGADFVPLASARRRLMELFCRRELRRTAYRVAAAAEDLSQDAYFEVPDQVAIQWTHLKAGLGSHRYRTLDDRIQEILEAGGKFDADGCAQMAWTGISAVDTRVRMGKGLNIIGARPNVGKSILGGQIACETAERARKVLYLNLDMAEEKYLKRLVAKTTGVEIWALECGQYSRGPGSVFEERRGPARNILLETLPAGTPWQILEGMIRETHRRFGVTVVVIDYFTQIKRPGGGRDQSDASAWAGLSTAIKGVAMELGICVVLLAQMNRAGAEGEAEIHQLRETGGLEQDAQTAIMLWRDKPKVPQEDGPKLIRAKIAKDQDGAAVGHVVTLQVLPGLTGLQEADPSLLPQPEPTKAPIRGPWFDGPAVAPSAPSGGRNGRAR